VHTHRVHTHFVSPGPESEDTIGWGPEVIGLPAQGVLKRALSHILPQGTGYGLSFRRQSMYYPEMVALSALRGSQCRDGPFPGYQRVHGVQNVSRL